MDEGEHRHLVRDSLFVMADLRLTGDDSEYRIRVRNLSSGGLMAEGGPKVARGQTVALNVRNIGWVDGSVAWVQGARYGIAFCDEIDPRVVRENPPADEPTALVRRPASSLAGLSEQSRLRKI